MKKNFDLRLTLPFSRLWLHNNKIKSLPNEIGNLVKLKELLVHNNNLYTFPTSISNLLKLKKFTFHGNKV